MGRCNQNKHNYRKYGIIQSVMTMRCNLQFFHNCSGWVHIIVIIAVTGCISLYEEWVAGPCLVSQARWVCTYSLSCVQYSAKQLIRNLYGCKLRVYYSFLIYFILYRQVHRFLYLNKTMKAIPSKKLRFRRKNGVFQISLGIYIFYFFFSFLCAWQVKFWPFPLSVIASLQSLPGMVQFFF